MGKKKDFYDRPLYSITEYLVSFILGNIYFLLCNIPLIFYSIMVAIEPEAFSVFMLGIFLIPTGPAITALLASMGKLVRDKEIVITKYYFKSYKENFFTSIKVWCIGLLAVFILLMDYRFFVEKGYVFGVIFLVAAVYLCVIGMYIFPLLSRFDIKLKKLVMLSLYYSIKKLPITITKILVVSVGYLVIFKVPIFSILGLFSLISYAFMVSDKALILELEGQVKNC